MNMKNEQHTMTDVMLDIETLSTRPSAVIVQIGACYFDRETGEVGDTFCHDIDIQASLDAGQTVDGGALSWWMTKQKDSITFFEDPLNPVSVLAALNKFLFKAKTIWSHATFDIPILCEAMRLHKTPPKFHYTQTRDIRTLTDLAGGNHPKVDGVSKTHNALDDCKYQVAYCVEYMKRLKNNTTDHE